MITAQRSLTYKKPLLEKKDKLNAAWAEIVITLMELRLSL